MRTWMVIIGVFISLALAACAPAISQQARDQVTTEITFEEILEDPRRVTGEGVLLGGKIITATPHDGGTEIVVLQLPLQLGMRPSARDTSAGRFLVQTDEFLDPAVYAPDRLVTLVGKVRGVQERPLGQTVYRYPELSLVELKLWPEPEIVREPRFRFGVGVGTYH